MLVIFAQVVFDILSSFEMVVAALYSIKPSIGLTSQEGVILVSHNFDVVGVMGKGAWDVAVGLSIIAESVRENYLDEIDAGWNWYRR